MHPSTASSIRCDLNYYISVLLETNRLFCSLDSFIIYHHRRRRRRRRHHHDHHQQDPHPHPPTQTSKRLELFLLLPFYRDDPSESKR